MMFVVPGDFSCPLSFYLGLNSMGIVKSQNSPVIAVMQGERILYAVGDMLIRRNTISFEFGPVSVIHRENLPIKLQQSFQIFIIVSLVLHHLTLSTIIIY